MCNSFCRKTIMLPGEYCATVLYHHKWPPKLSSFKPPLVCTIPFVTVGFFQQLFDGFHGLNNQMVLIRGGRETPRPHFKMWIIIHYLLSGLEKSLCASCLLISHQLKPNKSGNFCFDEADSICDILVAYLKSRNTHSIDMFFWGSAALLSQ